MATKRENATDIAVAEKEKIKEPSKFDVIVHNNDYTSYEEVIIILSNAFEMNHQEALGVANKVHTEGKGRCGTYSKEVAEMKLVLVSTIKETMVQMFPQRSREIKMLNFTIEKA
jgi:ATP-dependent Clp protease adaptor protein ClpS